MALYSSGRHADAEAVERLHDKDEERQMGLRWPPGRREGGVKPARRIAATWTGVLVAAVAASACDRSPALERGRATSSVQEVATQRGGESAETSARRTPAAGEAKSLVPIAAPGRVVAVGDLHGDLHATKRALELAGAVDRAGKWVGGNLTVVQTGDVLDRGDDEREIHEYLWKLRAEASAAGGRLILLSGNHELMNVAVDLRYVTPGGLSDFVDIDASALGAIRDRVPEPMLGRVAAFMPGGLWAKRLADQPVVALVAGTLFAHAGVLPEHLRYGLGAINEETSAWMRGEQRAAPEVLAVEDSPVWTRRYAEDTVDDATCRVLGEVLTRVSAKRLVVGHTVQYGGVTSACDGKLWRIDVGLARYYGSRHNQVLEVDQDQVKVLGR